MGPLKIATLVIFILTYVLLLALPKWRAQVAIGSGFILMCIGALPWTQFGSAVEWNVLMMLIGTMGIVSLFIKSQMPAYLADVLISKTPNVKWAIIMLSLFAGLISAFVDNVATVLMVAPIALGISKKLKISPVPSIIAIAISSNLQGAATLVGDTTSIMLGDYANMTFLDFFVYSNASGNLTAGLFWIVQLGALAATVVLLVVFRKDKQKIEHLERTKVNDLMPTVLLIAMLALLIGTSFIENKPDVTQGIICMGLMVVGIIYDAIRNKSAKVIVETAKDIDIKTILLLTGLFLVIGAVSNVGIIDDLANLLVKLSKGNIFALFSLLVWGSVLISAFIDNIPYVATMLPVVAGICTSMNINPTVLYFGLLLGASLGGNLTPIGASANVAGVGILRKEGYEVKTLTFMKISVPFTLVAVAVGYGLCWAFYG